MYSVTVIIIVIAPSTFMLNANMYFLSDESKVSKMNAVKLLDFNDQRVFIVSLSKALNAKIKM